MRLGGIAAKLPAWKQKAKPWLLAVEDPQVCLGFSLLRHCHGPLPTQTHLYGRQKACALQMMAKILLEQYCNQACRLPAAASPPAEGSAGCAARI